MLAIIFGFLNFFVSPDFDLNQEKRLLADSTKKPKRSKVIADTTGHFIHINRIFITGNRLTRDRIIQRELSIETGDIIYSTDLPDILENDKKKLFNTRLFNTVDIKMLPLEEGKVDLLIDLNERWYTFPVPIFELSDRNFNEWWQNYNHDLRRINYGLRLYQYNMRGRNETLRFHVQSGFQRRYELMYHFPYIDKKQKHGLYIDLGFLETKNPAFSTVDHKYVFAKADQILKNDRYAGLTYTYRNSFYQTHSVELKHRTTSVDDTLKFLNPNIIQEENLQQSYNSISYQFNSDHRDVFAYPLKGHQFIFFAMKTGLGLGDDVNKIETTLSYSKYLNLKNGFYLSNNTSGYWSNPDDLPYLNYGVLGLRKQFVRGYEIYIIEGPYFFLNKTTFKKLIFSRNFHWGAMPLEQFQHIPIAIYLKTYADFGYVKNYPYYEALDINTSLSDKFLRGAGFGVDIVGSYDMVIRLEYTFNAEGENGFFFHVKKEF